MATLYKCDRCGELHHSRDNVRSVEYPRLQGQGSWREFSSDESLTKDLCIQCTRALHEFFNIPQRKEPTNG